MFDVEAYLDTCRREVDATLDSMLPPESERPQVLHRAMRYSVFAGGKRIRPALCMLSSESIGSGRARALIPAAALELLHTYTLIHDDLPSMDNDDLRRGKPTLHKMFGEANAILAGDALLTLAFEVLAGASVPPPYAPGQWALELATASGSRGVVGGQCEDLAAEGGAPNPALLKFIHANKTAALIRAACRMGAIAAGAEPNALEQISRYGHHVGMAFQIADDLLNATSTPEQLGKSVGTDSRRGKLTYVTLYGLDRARAAAEEQIRRALEPLADWGARAKPLIAMAQYVTRRSY